MWGCGDVEINLKMWGFENLKMQLPMGRFWLKGWGNTGNKEYPCYGVAGIFCGIMFLINGDFRKSYDYSRNFWRFCYVLPATRSRASYFLTRAVAHFFLYYGSYFIKQVFLYF
jgi:hypothetical protein